MQYGAESGEGSDLDVTVNCDGVSDIAVETEEVIVIGDVVNDAYNAGTPGGSETHNNGYWFTNYNNFYSKMVGKKLTSITFYPTGAGTITFWGYNNLESPADDIDSTTAQAFLSEAYANRTLMFTITAESAGKTTFKLDGTDERVTISSQEMINSFPKCFCIRSSSDTADWAWNSSYSVGGKVTFIYNTNSRYTSGKLWFECTYEDEQTILETDTYIHYNDGTKKKMGDAIHVDLGASAVTFNDGDSLQFKYDTGELGEENKLKGKRFSFIGDSISTFSGYMPAGYAVWYPHGSVTSVEQTWWKKLLEMSGMVLGQNCAWSGSKVAGNASSTTSAAAGCSTRRVSDLALNGTPDIILTYIGINDLRYGNALGEWTKDTAIPEDSSSVPTVSEAYALMVNKVMTTYPRAVVFCCSCLDTSNTNSGSSTYPVTNANGMSIPNMNEAIREVCWGLGAHYIDLHACGITRWNLSQYMEDGSLHPNEAGHTLMANIIYGEIKKHFGN